MTDQPTNPPSALNLGSLGGMLQGLMGNQGGMFALLLAALSGGAGGIGALGGTSGTMGSTNPTDAAGRATAGMAELQQLLGGLGTAGLGAAGTAGAAGAAANMFPGAGSTPGETPGIGGLPTAVQQLVASFEAKGMGDAAHSWVGTGPNQSVTPEAVASALGPELVSQLGTATGMSHEEVTSKLSTALPSIVDSLTPDGTLPATGTP
jgi:uncharacterized protein YidB (DUF937 family)